MEGLDKEVEELFRESIEKLEKLGANVKEIDIPELSLSAFSDYVMMASELTTYNDELVKSSLEGFQDDVRTFLALGKSLDATQYLKAQQSRRELTVAFKIAFEEVDLLLGPTVPITTPAYKDDWAMQNLELTKHNMRFTAPANLAGIPALSVPMGLDSNVLPAGMQFLGKHLSEKQLLKAAKAWATTEPINYSAENVDV